MTAPEQILVLLALILTDGVATGCTVMVRLFELADAGTAQAADEISTQDTTSLLPKAVLTKAGLLVPVLMPFTFHWYTGTPPPLVAVAVNVTCVPAQTDVADALIVIAGVTAGATVIVMLLDIAVVLVAHAALLVSIQVTWSLLFRLVVVKVALLVPVFIPFTFHWYTGVLPPLVGVAVKVTPVPLHMDVADALILTVGVTAVPAEIVTALDVATAGLAQAEEDVIWQVTTSLLLSVAVVNVALLLPALLPFTFHW